MATNSKNDTGAKLPNILDDVDDANVVGGTSADDDADRLFPASADVDDEEDGLMDFPERPVLPEAVYDLIVAELVPGFSKKDDPQWVMTYKVVGGDWDGTPVRDYITFSDASIAADMIFPKLNALMGGKLPRNGFRRDSRATQAAVIGRVFRGLIKHETYNDTTSPKLSKAWAAGSTEAGATGARLGSARVAGSRPNRDAAKELFS